ncbi:hypothetical protein [Nocardiopsis sp. L17-MgMaSL7]|uniref:hypothetical protein n=1 Tax=Nocardiopsis sp. L17-MgMaSL7 TaxID=1938893 RepID=UPI000D70F09D|nr:hypothetical protein [Nocardiopsis sp. L17-MgMaSL7]PWV47237.1 ABC-type branched-subunit amino acid transport system substrate-binding protein [Nocardiopsis sp. L17-MgMaSL7]
MEQGRSSIGDLEFPLTRSELVRRIGSPLQRRRFRRTRAAAVLSTVVALVATMVGGVFGWPYLVCGTGLQQIEGECVGVNDGSSSFEADLDWLTSRIHSMNTEVEELAASRDDVEAFRIVMMTSFSLDGSADLSEEQIVRAVEGTYVALMRQNGFAETGSGVEVVAEGSRIFQLYLANEGSVQQGTDAVIDALESMVHDDIPLSVVIGQSSTTTKTEEVARELSELRIPMVAGSSTSTTINNVHSPGLIRAAPNNEDFAAALRDHLDREAESDQEPARGLLLVDENEADTFSLDLADQFRRYLDPYLVQNSLTFQGSAGSANTTVYFDHIANEICANPGTNAVFFAGRFSDLETFLRSLELRGCRAESDVPITVYSMELGLLPDMIRSYSGTECAPADDDSAGEHYRLVQASAFDPSWLEEGAWSPEGFDDYRAAVTTTVRAETESTSVPEDFYSGYSLVYYDAATIAARATLLGFEASDESTLTASVRNHLFRVTREPTGSGHVDYLEELEGRGAGRHIPILSSDCSVDADPFRTPDVPYDELYPDLAN